MHTRPSTDATSAANDFPQVCYRSGAIIKEREKVGGGSGEGTLFCEYAFHRDNALPGHAMKEIVWLTFPSGASIGMHAHENNEDAYIIVSGSGIFTDSNGKEFPVKAGDTTIARKGESHALKNTGTEPMLVLNVIAQQ